MLVVVAGALALSATAREARADAEDLAVVKIEARGTCSAFLVGRTTFLTAKHCVVPAGGSSVDLMPSIYVDRGDGSRETVTVTASSARAAPGVYHDDSDVDGQDYAALEVARPYAEEVPGIVPIAVYHGDLARLVGEQVELVGFGLENGAYARKHAFATVRSVGVTIVVEPGVACPGDSGGVLLRASTREAIGIASREWELGSNPCAPNAHPADSSIFARIDQAGSLLATPASATADVGDAGTGSPIAPSPSDAGTVVGTGDTAHGCSAGGTPSPDVATALGVAFLALGRLRGKPRRRRARARG